MELSFLGLVFLIRLILGFVIVVFNVIGLIFMTGEEKLRLIKVSSNN